MAKATSMAAGDVAPASDTPPAGPSVAPPGSEAGNPPTAAPSAPAASLDDVAALKAQLAEQQAAHKREIQALQSAIPSQADVANFIAQAVAAAMAGRPVPTSSEQQTLEKQLAKLEVEQKAREDKQLKDLADLAAGPKVFTVCKADEPRMLRIVGAVDIHHAKAKYEAFMGIRHSEIQTTITETERPPLGVPGANAA